MLRRLALPLALSALALLVPVIAGANARLVSVVPLDGGCVAGPLGAHDETWCVEPGRIYLVRIDHVHESGHDGQDPTLPVVLQMAIGAGTPVCAVRVTANTYQFIYRVPRTACVSAAVGYGLGVFTGRHDTGLNRSLLSPARFQDGCTNPVPVSCTTPTRASTWGMMKSVYR